MAESVPTVKEYSEKLVEDFHSWLKQVDPALEDYARMRNLTLYLIARAQKEQLDSKGEANHASR